MQHEGNGAEDVVAEAESSSDGGGDPPKVGDVCIDERGVAQVFIVVMDGKFGNLKSPVLDRSPY
ncbi:MAG: hypothetical protein IPN46_06080 [Saprospiraceae bacterium]|nr:hypothetical protein [Saprospiraceae bacterium]